MSKLNELRGSLNAIATDARSVAGNLSGFRGKFGRAVAEVEAAIGGSARRTDREIIEALQAADKQVQAAVAALGEAARRAQNYGDSL